MSIVDVHAKADLDHSCNWKCCFGCRCQSKDEVAVAPQATSPTSLVANSPSPPLLPIAHKVQNAAAVINTPTDSPLPIHRSIASFYDHEFQIVVVKDGQ